MSRLRWSVILGLAAVLAIVPAARAQQPNMRIGYVFPAGARQGTTVVVVIGGRYLDGATQAHVSGAGVQAKVVDFLKPTRPGDLSTLVASLKKLEQKKPSAPKENEKRPEGETKPSTNRASRNAVTAEDEMVLAAIKRKVAVFVGGPPVPAIGESVLVQLTIAPNAEPGPREIRLETPKGITNPLTFCVGQLPEFFKEPNLSEELLSGKGFSSYRDEPRLQPLEPPTLITLPAVANGQITPGGTDRYRFQARKGQRLVIAASAEELIPYISDAVPGWFQAVLTLYDAKGKELAYADHHLFHPDPVLYYEVPEDGEYLVAIRDSLYRGRDDFVYRITLGEIPLITSIFPLGGPAGAQTTVELAGWNLPVTRITQDVKEEPGVYPLRVRKEELVSNALPFAVDTLPECLEKEPNNQPAEAQPVTLPIIVNGRIDQPDDWDVFRFEGRAGDEIVAEVYARRLGSPLDSVLKLTDAAGKQLAMNDDHVDKGAGLTTHQADSYLRFTLPANGSYYLSVGDAQHHGGPAYAYRLRIGPSRPDFDLRIVPSSFNIRPGTNIPLTVYALRKDGFDGPISLALKDARQGATLNDGVVPAGEDLVKLTLKIPPMQPGEPIRLSMEGRATIRAQEVSRLAVPAEDMTQAFEYRHLVPAQELKVALLGRFVFRPTVKIVSKTPVKIPAGGTAKVQFSVSPRWVLGQDKPQLELRSPPKGISVEEVLPSREGMEVVLQADAAKVKPGQRGNLSLVAAATKPAESEKTKTPAGQPQRPALPNLPSIQFEIVKP